MLTGRAARELDLAKNLTLRSRFAVHLHLAFVLPYRSARYLFAVYPQAGIIANFVVLLKGLGHATLGNFV